MKTEIRQHMNDDSGMALFTVVMMSFVLFILVTSLLVLQNYYSSMMAMRGSRISATHIADAGLNDYLYQIKNKSSYYRDVPDTGWVDFGGGRYRVVAVAPTTNAPLTLYCTGSKGTSVTIAATVAYPTFSDYMFLYGGGGDLWIDDSVAIRGKVRSNGNVKNDGHITGGLYAGGNITGGGSADQGTFAPVPMVDFSAITAKRNEVKTAVLQNSPSSHFPTNVGTYSYRVTFSGSNYLVERVDAVIAKPNANYTGMVLGNYPVPANGAIYFDDTVWIQGTYNSNVTLVSSEDIYIIGSYLKANPAATYSSVLMSAGNVIIFASYPTMPQDMTIQTAVVAENGEFYTDRINNDSRHSMNFIGSIAALSDTKSKVDWTGQDRKPFDIQTYNYDENLGINPSVFSPVIGDGKLKVSTWIEEGGIR